QKVDLSSPQTIAELLKDDGVNYKNDNNKEILQQSSLETERNSRLMSILKPEANFQEYIPLNTTVQSRMMSTVDSRANSPIDDFFSSNRPSIALESSNEPDSLNKLSKTVSSPSRLTRSTPLKSRDNALNVFK
ncbi:11222_t:CDS:1, partial [Funneliformis mosseae]